MSVSDEDVMKFCDGVMSTEDATRLRRIADRDSELARRIRAMEASNLPYAKAFEQQRIPAMPASLLNNLEKWKKQATPSAAPPPPPESPFDKNRAANESPRRAWRLTSIAASLATAFLIGYSVSNLTNKPPAGTDQLTHQAQADWVQRVADYQTLYVENTVTSVIRGPESASALLSRIESVADIRTGIPDLSAHGYSFVRAQELGYKGQPLVQLVYYKPGVAPLALCYMPSFGAQSAQLTISEHEMLKAGDWIDDGQRFVIVAEESKSVIQKLYEDARAHWS